MYGGYKLAYTHCNDARLHQTVVLHDDVVYSFSNIVQIIFIKYIVKNGIALLNMNNK